MDPTEKQINAAHAAWESVVSKWRLRRVSGHVGETWLVENYGIPNFVPDRDYGSEIAYHRFDGPDAEKRARFLLRDKCIKAALSAALSA